MFNFINRGVRVFDMLREGFDGLRRIREVADALPALLQQAGVAQTAAAELGEVRRRENLSTKDLERRLRAAEGKRVVLLIRMNNPFDSDQNAVPVIGTLCIPYGDGYGRYEIRPDVAALVSGQVNYKQGVFHVNDIVAVDICNEQPPAVQLPSVDTPGNGEIQTS